MGDAMSTTLMGEKLRLIDMKLRSSNSVSKIC